MDFESLKVKNERYRANRKRELAITAMNWPKFQSEVELKAKEIAKVHEETELGMRLVRQVVF